MSIQFDILGICGVVEAGKDTYYIAPNNRNAIFRVDINTRRVQWVCDLPFKYPFAAIDLIAEGNVIWCVARKGLQIAAYDLCSDKMELFLGGNENRDNLVSVLGKKNIFILPKDLPGKIVGFSITDMKYYYPIELNIEIKKLDIRDHLMAYTVSNGKISATLKKKSSIIIFDILLCKVFVYDTHIQDNFWGITVTENGYCVTSCHKKRIYFLDLKRNNVNVYENGNGHYNQIFKIGTQYFLSGIEGIDVIQYGRFQKILEKAKQRFAYIGSTYIFTQLIGTKLILWPWNSNKLLEIDRDTFQYEEYSLCMEFYDYIYLYMSIFEGELTIVNYINEALLYKIPQNDCFNRIGIGEKIYERIKE